jgi:hypothetical protein
MVVDTLYCGNGDSGSRAAALCALSVVTISRVKRAAAEHAHAARPPSAREIVGILASSFAARLVGG